MASQKLVVSELLAFLQHQLDVMDEISVIQICTSNYDEEEIRSAKALLYESLGLIDRMPSRRRDDKGERSLQDMIRLFKITDPDDVPTFVAKELRKLPPVTFDHVDVSRLLKDITTLKASLSEMQFKFECSQKTISELRAEVVDLRNTVTSRKSPVTSNIDPSSAPNNGKQSCTSAKCDASSTIAAAIPARDIQPCPAHPASPAGTSMPPRGYATAASQLLPKPAVRQIQKAPKKSLPSAPMKNNVDAEGFTLVEKRRKSTRRNQCGTALTGPNMLLRAAIPTTQLYVSRLMDSTKAVDIVDYIKVKTGLEVKVAKLDSRHAVNFTSFVVRVPTEQLATFMNEDFWPRGVVFRRFRGTLPDTKQRSASPSLRANM